MRGLLRGMLQARRELRRFAPDAVLGMGSFASVPVLAAADTQRRNAALLAMADALEADSEAILAANPADVAASRDTLGTVMIDRLTRTKARSADMAAGIR